jgi:uncharacterized protein (TIGR02594 family)
VRTGPFLFACALAVAFTGHAHSKPRHVRAPAPTTSFWSALQGSDLVTAARAELGRGPVYGRSNLWCARFVNYVLERTGRKGTGSDLAWSFAKMPSAGMQVGAIAVMRHHVGIVSGVTRNGDPVLISGNNAGRVREAVYPRSRVAAFVSPN